MKITMTYLIAAVWLVNGIYCKVLNYVPRHEQIVARILGDEYARSITILIGIAEVVMAIWIISLYRPKLNAFAQISVVGIMNIIEYSLAPDLLLWGVWNLLFALLFMIVVYLTNKPLINSI